VPMAETAPLPIPLPIPEPEPKTVPPPVVIPDYFVPSQKPKLAVKQRSPSRDYPRLISLLRGDNATADRLLQSLLDSYPDKSERWCYEKAVFDLSRDRH
jgi:hypothetical protein